jgi:Ribonuclease HepT-like
MQIPCNKIVGMRNRLIHAYFEIDLDVLWKTITEDILPLISALKSKTEQFCKELLTWNKPMYTFHSESNAELIAIGMKNIEDPTFNFCN